MKSVNEEPGSPFDSIEGAHEYMRLLREALEEAQHAIQQDADIVGWAKGNARRIEALQIVTYKLNQLGEHLAATRRLLNDLRTLRRLLFREREDTAAAPPDRT
jgi:hypothetical protein